jgi:hypothetical protein
VSEPTQPPPPTYLIRAFDAAGRWGVPLAMGGAYIMLMIMSGTDRTGRIWMAFGFVLVMIVWFAFRALADDAGLSRAVFVGDTEKLFSLTATELFRQHGKPSRLKYLVARALAFELVGEPTKALELLDGITPPPAWQLLAHAIRLSALLDLNRAADAPPAPSVPPTPGLSSLVDGLALVAAGDRATATPLFERAASEIRAGNAVCVLATRHLPPPSGPKKTLP